MADDVFREKEKKWIGDFADFGDGDVASDEWSDLDFQRPLNGPSSQSIHAQFVLVVRFRVIRVTLFQSL